MKDVLIGIGLCLLLVFLCSLPLAIPAFIYFTFRLVDSWFPSSALPDGPTTWPDVVKLMIFCVALILLIGWKRSGKR